MARIAAAQRARRAKIKAAKTLEQCADEVAAISAAARSIRDDVIILCHGGPIAMPADAKFILDRCREVNGFYGASSMERLPVELAIQSQVETFKALKTGDRP